MQDNDAIDRALARIAEQDDARDTPVYPDVDRLVDLGYMQDFGLGYPEWS